MTAYGRELRILHLENDPADAERIHDELRRAGLPFTAHRVDSEHTFRLALANMRPDIILADDRLPEFHGQKALHIARELAPHVPFIFACSTRCEERAIEALHEGATDYVLKDRPSRLPSAIGRALRERDAQLARARAEHAVVESEQRFRYAALATRDVICDHDLASGLIYVNEAIQTQWGHAPAGIDAQWWIEHIHPDDRQRVIESYSRWLASDQERWTIEYRFRRGDGTYGSAVQHALVLRDRDGRALRIIGAMQDVTESRRLREQLERAERIESLGRLAAIVAHEFNNVLMAISPVAEVLGRNADAQVARLAAKIVDSVDRGRRVVGEVQRMTQMSEPVAETIDVAAMLADLRPDVQAMIGDDVAVQLDVPASPVWIRCDRSHLQQVLANLIVNARDAMPAGGTLRLALAVRDGEVTLSVSDTGSGIPRHVLPHIFEPLFTTKRSGTGLGLAISYRLLRQNGAAIAVDSTPGNGTTFSITFKSAEAPDEVKDTAVPDRPRSSMRVLLVEDNRNVSEGITLLLESEGFEVRAVERGSDAVRAAEWFRPDLVLLDISLPDMPGTRVFDELAARWPSLPVIFTSGNVELAGVGDRVRRPNVAFLRKPFSLETLLEVIAQVSRAADGSRRERGGDIAAHR